MRKLFSIMLGIVLMLTILPTVALTASAVEEEDHKHVYVERITIEPTCEGDGVMITTCSVENCDFWMRTVLDPIGHKYLWKSGVMPPDSKDRHWQECNNCGDIINIGSHVFDPVSCTASLKKCKLCFVNIGITPIGHSLEDKEGQAATCDTPGYTPYQKCRRCPFEQNKSTIDALGHKYDTWEITEEPTCEGYGLKTYFCANDNSHTTTEPINPTDHKWNAGEITQKPTCTEAGVKTYTCLNDETHTTTEPVNPTDHNWGSGSITTPPTCEGFGVRTYTCQNDSSHTKTENVNPTDHNWDLANGKVTLAPTCTEYGVKTYSCLNNPEHATTEPINPTDHKWDLANGKITTDPTCTEYGVKTYICLNDPEHSTTEPVNPLGHNMSTEWEHNDSSHWKKCLNTPCTHTEELGAHAAADWTKDATGHWHQCDVCGRKLDETVKHNYSDWTVKQEATCEKKGSKERTCKDCGWIDTEETPTLPHTYDDKGWVIDQEASCTVAGSKHRLCTVCMTEASRQPDAISATGHNMGAWYDTEDGEHHRRECQNVNPIEAKTKAAADGVKCSYVEERDHVWKEVSSHHGRKELACEFCNAKKTVNFYHPHYWGSNPKTGDSIMTTVVVMVLAAAGLVCVTLYGIAAKSKKRKNK